MKTNLGNKSVNVAKWAAIVAANTPPPPYDKWAPEREEELVRLRKKDISMGDTAFGRVVEGKKRELNAVVKHHDRAERATLRAKLDALGTADDAAAAGGTEDALDLAPDPVPGAAQGNEDFTEGIV